MESGASGQDPAAAAAQLAALQADRERLAERVRDPWWYGPALGLLVFLLFGSVSTHDPRLVGAALVVFVGGLSLLKWRYVRLTGIWVSGWRPGRMRVAVATWTVLYAVVVAASVGLEQFAGIRGAMAVGGLVLGVGIALINRWWTRLFIAELREQR